MHWQVTYADAAGRQGLATTDESGSYSMTIAGATTPQQLSGNLLRLAKGGNCVDQGTQLTLPVSLGALIPNCAAGVGAQMLGITRGNSLTRGRK